MGAQALGSRYLLEDPIGQGGMGVVWRGRDRETGDSCAIKLLRPEFAADPSAVTRFVRERTALVRFRHPNVVTLRDMIVEGDCLALVMDFVEGGDLGDYRRRGGGTLPLAEALRVMAQVCDALAAAHAAGIVHRDLKPANVLLDAGQVRLADFGIARIAGESPATTTGTMLGTIGFIAPEVIRGEEPSPACDVYAVGITLYELLTGALPFTGQAAAVMHAHLDTAPTRPYGMSDRLWALVSACLSKDPDNRPSAMVVARALRDPALGGEATPQEQGVMRSGGPQGQAVPAGRALSPQTDAVLAGASPQTDAAVVGVGAAGSGMGSASWDIGWAGSGMGPVSPPPGPGRSPGRPGDRRGPGRFGIRPVWAAAAAVVLVFAGIAGTYLTMSGHSASTAANPLASPLVAATQSRTAALAGSASPAASHRPSAGAATPASTSPPVASATAVATPAGAPGGTPEGPTGPNLVADGDFSAPTLSGWNDQVLNTVVVSAGARGGHAAQMTGGPKAGVTQTITGLKPGREYELTGWIISRAGHYSTYVGVKDYDSTAGFSRALNAARWSETVITFTPAPGHTTAKVFCWQAIAGIGYCTDISVRAMS